MATTYWSGFRNTAPAGANTEWTDMMTGMCFNGYVGPHDGYYGLVQTNSKNITGQGTLYAAHTIRQPVTALLNQLPGVELSERCRHWMAYPSQDWNGPVLMPSDNRSRHDIRSSPWSRSHSRFAAV